MNYYETIHCNPICPAIATFSQFGTLAQAGELAESALRYNSDPKIDALRTFMSVIWLVMPITLSKLE